MRRANLIFHPAWMKVEGRVWGFGGGRGMVILISFYGNCCQIAPGDDVGDMSCQQL